MRRRWWNIPAEVFRVFLHRRSMIPAPYIYLVALLVGVALGVGLDAWLGWPWWLVALVFLLLVWLAFLSTAFIGPMRGRSLRDEFLDAIDPGGAADRRRREEERFLRSCPFRLYGLDAAWNGLRSLGGHSVGGRMPGSVELAHGDPGSHGPWLRIETALPGAHGPDDLRYEAIELWHRAEQPPTDLPIHLKSTWRERRSEEHYLREAHWTKVSVPVDGASVEFDWLEEGSEWVARATIGDVVVTIRGHRFPVETVRLETLTDVERYIEGSRRYHEEQRRLHEE
jgi:hypothetical protein